MTRLVRCSLRNRHDYVKNTNQKRSHTARSARGGTQHSSARELRFPGDVRIHFFSTDCLSFSDQIHLQERAIMQVSVVGYERPLRNPLRIAKLNPTLMRVSRCE